MLFSRKKPVHFSPAYIVFGLGNPGGKYSGTRHNLGWWVLDELARRHKPQKTQALHRSQVDFVKLMGPQEEIICALVKPVTYMNNSGDSVRDWLRAFPDAQWAVVYDDLDLAPGKMRLRREGSAGGHNGMKSIVQALGGSQDFARLRIGIGKPDDSSIDSADYVLEPPTRAEREQIINAIPRAADVLEYLVEYGFETAQMKLGSMSNSQ
ncbi:MAG: aminoacyl-tRNA hydrolase [bacterium]|nr:aminoacyl-tRNA hydrolase [bacterium]